MQSQTAMTNGSTAGKRVQIYEFDQLKNLLHE